MEIFINTESEDSIFVDTSSSSNSTTDLFNIFDDDDENNVVTIGNLQKKTKNNWNKYLNYNHKFDNDFIEDIFPDIIDFWVGDFPYKTYTCSSNQIIPLQCKIKHKWYRTINDHVSRGYFTCFDCIKLKYPNISRNLFYWGESICKYVFIKYNISFKYQYKLDGKIFDFFVNGKIIEYDGSHHFNTKYLNASNLSNIPHNDIIKTKICLKNNIPILRISYKEIIDIEQWILKFLISNQPIMVSNKQLYDLHLSNIT